MSNVVFQVNIKGHRVKPEFELSTKSWATWCKKNNIEHFVLTEHIYDLDYMNANCHKFFVLELLEKQGVDYDQVCIVDADTIVHPKCPNFFELTDNKFTGVHCDASYDWVIRSLENYSKYAFGGFMSKFYNYIDCGFMVVNESHKEFFKNITNFYHENSELLKEIETKLHVGTDQTPVNILVERENIDLKLLPYEFNMVDMNRKEILTPDLLFTKIGWIYQFNCIPNNEANKASYQ